MVSVSSMPAENVSVSALLSPWRSMRAVKASADIDRSVKSWFPKGSDGVGPVIAQCVIRLVRQHPFPKNRIWKMLFLEDIRQIMDIWQFLVFLSFCVKS